ncbi:uncharacterized protein Ecym_6407 [Eremothecium cymbalariae DBVPG|uniref:Uncharacterized protein n=1 Tax=Eremothecium cymbalariae (strain CBS 270.75 / DBVPG 7215 / KCTC 17166 / NRRL Y-17582) TaxID=931890 RepID=G8JUK0_ERECY|nr:hypothetical protein Ecym_6407 [Eremothecium cymbalariae DBVPG\
MWLRRLFRSINERSTGSSLLGDFSVIDKESQFGSPADLSGDSARTEANAKGNEGPDGENVCSSKDSDFALSSGQTLTGMCGVPRFESERRLIMAHGMLSSKVYVFGSASSYKVYQSKRRSIRRIIKAMGFQDVNMEFGAGIPLLRADFMHRDVHSHRTCLEHVIIYKYILVQNGNSPPFDDSSKATLLYENALGIRLYEVKYCSVFVSYSSAGTLEEIFVIHRPKDGPLLCKMIGVAGSNQRNVMIDGVRAVWVNRKGKVRCLLLVPSGKMPSLEPNRDMTPVDWHQDSIQPSIWAEYSDTDLSSKYDVLGELRVGEVVEESPTGLLEIPQATEIIAYMCLCLHFAKYGRRPETPARPIVCTC